jgi:hypothetical protein
MPAGKFLEAGVAWRRANLPEIAGAQLLRPRVEFIEERTDRNLAGEDPTVFTGSRGSKRMRRCGLEAIEREHACSRFEDADHAEDGLGGDVGP